MILRKLRKKFITVSVLLILIFRELAFLDSVDEVVENLAEEGEQRILDTYEPAPVYESDSDAGDIQDVAVISCKAALEALELLRLFRLQNPHVNLQRSEQMEGFCIEKSGILRVYQVWLAGHSIRQPLRNFLLPTRIFFSFCIYILL